MQFRLRTVIVLATCALGVSSTVAEEAKPTAEAAPETEVPAAEAAAPEEAAPRIDWKRGPVQVDLGKELAQLQLPDGYLFAEKEQAQQILASMGNQTNGSELGLVVPQDDNQNWFVVFEWDPVGYVKDDEKDKIDADAILASIQEATEAGNEWRKENGIPALHVTGWAEPPRYDEASHNLVWATLAKSDTGHMSSNYNMRLLGRHGVVSAVLVEEADKLALAKPFAHEIVKGFSFKPGGTYAEFQQGDRVAEYGLTALVAAGAGAAALKLGFFGYLAKLFAKFGKALIVGLAAVGAVGAKVWNTLRGRKAQPEALPEP